MDAFTPKPTIWTSNPKLKNLLLVFIIVLLASGIGLAVLAQVQANYRQKVYEETQAGLPVHKAGASEDQKIKVWDTSNWQTYSDSKIGVQIKMPADWYISSERTFYQTDDEGFRFRSEKDSLQRPMVEVTITRSNDFYDSGGFYEYTLPNGILGKRKVSGSSTQKIQYIDILHNDYNYTITTYFLYDYASLNGKLMNNESDYKTYSQEELALLDAILSTFKFTK